MTELITRLDLVEAMLNVAAGRALPYTQEQVRCARCASQAVPWSDGNRVCGNPKP